MGLLSLGTPLTWHEAKQHNNLVRSNGIEQLINIHRQSAARTHDKFYWGDEVEYMLVRFDAALSRATLSIDEDEILNVLHDAHPECVAHNISFHPEYGRYMLEATPARPYDGRALADYLYVEQNMAYRRSVSRAHLPRDVVPLTITAFPRMGLAGFTSPPHEPNGVASQSLFLPDEIINRHVRFPTLTANIRARRGSKVAINLPIFRDTRTDMRDALIPATPRGLFTHDSEPYQGAALPGHVYMDSMGFGMGCSCLQITVQAQDINEARYLYDSLANFAPVLLSATAASPIFKGYLVAQDVRWNVISGAVDDRTPYERGVAPLAEHKLFGGLDVDEARTDKHAPHARDGKDIQRIPKSRYDSISNYLSDEHTTGYYKPEYNDVAAPINAGVYAKLQANGFDAALANHFAHLFIRDPLVLFSERVSNSDNAVDNDHFENLQSTNWQTLRFKPPAPFVEGQTAADPETPGWRVEFRPMEIQVTDFENAAYSVIIPLFARAILKYKPNYYLPLSQVDANMVTAHGVNSVLEGKFYARKHTGLDVSDFAGFDLGWFDRKISQLQSHTAPVATEKDEYNLANGVAVATGDDSVVEVSVNDVINGTATQPGLVHMVTKIIASTYPDASVEQLEQLQAYLKLVSYRASGKLPTFAKYARDFVVAHPAYEADSRVSEQVNYDLCVRVAQVTAYEEVGLFGKELGAYLMKHRR
ncbi:hypothetical protein BABINDRAFT_163018 [Babjeviella inositovora NRRL Y-12698]|uniref:Glutamate--cysteine ligase n=1 Tax=Babjeviella inositovora NRRL Y-12698 TaxID=984486 RepID=A0A1E3QLV9_9ASCO|nr:uncharacterized protein BABINDRAFT_163018 [Babjeviella inositovora NRRL Y-12698]ODQ77967.1 hypothetical protein BABINDRAFT_163018 [Babjeviella inositovora NRRL Y-12698]